MLTCGGRVGGRAGDRLGSKRGGDCMHSTALWLPGSRRHTLPCWLRTAGRLTLYRKAPSLQSNRPRTPARQGCAANALVAQGWSMSGTAACAAQHA